MTQEPNSKNVCSNRLCQYGWVECWEGHGDEAVDVGKEPCPKCNPNGDK